MAEINLIKEETIQVDLTNESPIDTQVPDINYIPAYKVAEEQRRANENERIVNENERIEYYEEVRRDVENGEFDGKNTVYIGETEPIDDYYEVWVNPEGTPEVSAENLVFSDNETLQDKYDSGELKGEQGPKGDKGDKGDKGETGPQGPQGPQGDTPDLTDYATKEYVENKMATLEVDLTSYYTKTEINELLEEYYSTEETFTGKYWIDGKKIYRKTIVLTGIEQTSSLYTVNVSEESLSRIFVDMEHSYIEWSSMGLTFYEEITLEPIVKGNSFIIIRSEAGYTPEDIICIPVEYTKTTD